MHKSYGLEKELCHIRSKFYFSFRLILQKKSLYNRLLILFRNDIKTCFPSLGLHHLQNYHSTSLVFYNIQRIILPQYSHHLIIGIEL